MLAASPALAYAQPGAAVFVVLAVSVPGKAYFYPAKFVAVDFFPFGTGHYGDLRAVHEWAVGDVWPPGFVGGHGAECVVVAGGFGAALFFHGLGLFAGMGNSGQQPVAIQLGVVVFGEFGFGTAGEVCAVAFAVGGAGVVSEGVQPGFGKGLPAGIGFKAAGVVKVLVILPLVGTGGSVFVHQGVGGVFEGIVFGGYRRGANPLFVAETEYSGLFGASAGFAVVFGGIKPWRIAVVVSNNQTGLFTTIHAAVLVAVVPTFFGGQSPDKGKIAFPVLYAVFPFLGRALQIELSTHNAPLFQQGTHDGVCSLSLEDAAVVHHP